MRRAHDTPGADHARERFDGLWHAHYPLVLAYVSRRAPGAARDVTSEVFLVAWRRLDSVPDDAGPWLLAVARKVLGNHLRAASRRRFLSDRLKGTVAPPGGDPSDSMSGGGLREAFASLPPTDRELLALIAWEGLSTHQAAVVLGCSRATLAVRLHRARRRLGEALGERPDARPEGDPDKPEGQTA